MRFTVLLIALSMDESRRSNGDAGFVSSSALSLLTLRTDFDGDAGETDESWSIPPGREDSPACRADERSNCCSVSISFRAMLLTWRYLRRNAPRSTCWVSTLSCGWPLVDRRTIGAANDESSSGSSAGKASSSSSSNLGEGVGAFASSCRSSFDGFNPLLGFPATFVADGVEIFPSRTSRLNGDAGEAGEADACVCDSNVAVGTFRS